MPRTHPPEHKDAALNALEWAHGNIYDAQPILRGKGIDIPDRTLRAWRQEEQRARTAENEWERFIATNIHQWHANRVRLYKRAYPEFFRDL